ncbi:hypothetical protein [Paenibacillus segetis]|uniref:Uncharacterized protein n=1 Tax=Paenibacillus segetis TaxID=1325360 RepID=A0ABQ1Y8G8_9BACL|nr:hypothetical protein [Paenibacillus segetis]GGH16369.1 hypothetical protein GCM10008013_11120 [Paenibacillus segetis]
MSCKLVIVEGLPGSGKSTHAKWVQELLMEKGIDARLFAEGNLDHPADYDGVACFEQDEYNNLLLEYPSSNEIIEERTIKQGQYRLIPYRKMLEENGSDLPAELMKEIFQKDIYELPFEKHVQIVTDKWIRFAEAAHQGAVTYVFECCFIQNPMTIGLVKYDTPQWDIFNYILKLEATIKDLNPLVIYVNQNDVKASFEKAVQDRPQEWSEGFIDYYTNQGFGLTEGLSGLEGTIEVLRQRKKLELHVFSLLNMNKALLDNSQLDSERSKQELRGILEEIVWK